MTLPTQPLRDEHRELWPQVESLRTLAEAAPLLPTADLRRRVVDAVAFLQGHLGPHAAAEERVLYPAVAKLMGAPSSTATMTRDHVEVHHLIRELAAVREEIERNEPGPGHIRDLQRLAYGLYALLKVHFAKEEEIYLPLLDAHVTAASAAALFHQMEDAAAAARAAA